MDTGAVLMQADVNGVRMVSYFSKKFKPFKLRYSVIEKESLALVFCPPNILMCMLVQAVLLWCIRSQSTNISTVSAKSTSTFDEMGFIFAA